MPEQFRIATLGKPRAPWRDSQEAAMNDAIRLNLASWDQSKRQHFLAVPVEMQRRGRKDHPAPADRGDRHGLPWTDDDIARLRALIAGGEDPGVVALRLGRSRDSVTAKARQLGVSSAKA